MALGAMFGQGKANLWYFCYVGSILVVFCWHFPILLWYYVVFMVVFCDAFLYCSCMSVIFSNWYLCYVVVLFWLYLLLGLLYLCCIFWYFVFFLFFFIFFVNYVIFCLLLLFFYFIVVYCVCVENLRLFFVVF